VGAGLYTNDYQKYCQIIMQLHPERKKNALRHYAQGISRLN